MSFVAPPTSPTPAGFLSFLRQIAGIPVAALPDDSLAIAYAYAMAVEITYFAISYVSPLTYTLAVYNLGTSNIINYAQDPVPPTEFIEINGKEVPYFQALRMRYNTYAFTAGVVQASADGDTSVTMLTPDYMKELTLANLQQLKDPFGRRYLELVQSAGPLWGLTQ